jgi:hypothetical protein
MNYNNIIKSRYALTTINSGFTDKSLVDKDYVVNQVVLTSLQIKKRLRVKKLANIIGIKKSKQHILPGYIFVPYIMAPTINYVIEGDFKKSIFYRKYNQQQRLKKLKDILNG